MTEPSRGLVSSIPLSLSLSLSLLLLFSASSFSPIHAQFQLARNRGRDLENVVAGLGREEARERERGGEEKEDGGGGGRDIADSSDFSVKTAARRPL